MTDHANHKQHKWSGLNQHIDRWLEHRGKLLAHYCKIANLPPFEHQNNSLPSAEEINAFCGDLVDYVSEGHFEIYEEIITAYEEEHRERMELGKYVVPAINDTTDEALNFHDKYTIEEKPNALDKLDEDLCNLGELMEKRFELEDLLLEKLHSSHK
tara:strand:- start:35566 stop:36033 length:468 start_codon:yes stop_codon:yes gene_type:complete